MIAISPIRTPRISADLKELSIGDAIYLCMLPADQKERGDTELLNRIIEPTDKLMNGQVCSPRAWTLQERFFAVAHYLAHVIDGGPNFAVGKSGHYMDYFLSGENVCPSKIDIGSAAGITWAMRPIYGAFSESIERLVLSDELTSNRQGWLIGAMAAQVFDSTEDLLDIERMSDSAVDDYLVASVKRLFEMPQSEFIELLLLYSDGQQRLNHLFKIEITDSGIAVLPCNTEVPDLPPARFHFSLAVSEGTHAVFGLPDRGLAGADALLQSDDVFGEADDILGREVVVCEQGVQGMEGGAGARNENAEGDHRAA